MHLIDYYHYKKCVSYSVFDGLNHITRNILNDPIAPGSISGTLMPYDQNVFLDGDAYGASFYEQGFYYAPPRCIDGTIQCKLHVFFHGCEMGYEYIGTDFIQTAGFLEVAEANDMIMLFPTVITTRIESIPRSSVGQADRL